MKNARGALRIFLQFLKFGCFTFGGGLNIIAQMQRLYVDEEKRISSVELLDLTSVARSLPGLFVGNVAFLYGYRESGYPGAFAALFGMVIPPMIVLGFITYFYTIFHTQATVMAGMTGVRAAVVPIMASALLGLLRGAFPMRACYAVAAAALAAYFFFNVKRQLRLAHRRRHSRGTAAQPRGERRRRRWCCLASSGALSR